ncbi:unnamed protein product [Thlaspi arvense]|uniref:Pectinesterase inhibitor domain-containing protein n=1 Tax=Thlaspi arvense TaxID=13288 RepID=A0AAU9RR04_THLAR|nr:unnamed protein product [Thlaspi arvense]
MDYNFCVTSLESDPQSKTATSVLGLLIASTTNAASNTISVRGIAQKIFNDGKTSPAVKAALQDCIKFYGDAIDSLNEALTAVKSHDYSSANVQLSAAFDVPSNCEDGFKEGKQAKSPITNENNVLTQRILIPLAFSNMV